MGLTTISRFARKDENRQLIEVEKEKLVKVLPDAVQNVKDLLEEMKDILKDDTKRRELSYKASKDALKATNVFPSLKYAHNIYNDNRQQQTMQISATIANLIGGDIMRKLEELENEEVT